jgi:GNAT superfamily N-acetyltransferase
MAQAFTLRPATPADAGELLRLIGELAKYEKLEHMVVGTESMLVDALFGSKVACEAVMAEFDGQAVGFALFFTTFSTFLCKPGIYLEDVFVEPAHRGKGIGKALLRHLASLARERGCGRFEWRVLDWNEPSIRFYESLGASVLREWLLVRMTEPEFTRFAAGAQVATSVT